MASITNKAGKQMAIHWASTNVSPGELWIHLPASGRLPDMAADFDGQETLVIVQEEKEEHFEGYTRLTHAMLDGEGITLRISREVITT